MEKLHSSRPWRKNIVGSAVMATSDFDDVFGGAPKHTSPFSLQPDDYFEIFGSVSSASSIPLLDLPPADDYEIVAQVTGGHRRGVDYSDVFGMFGGGVFAASYEELFPEPKRSRASSEGRACRDVPSEHQEKKDLEHPLKTSNVYDANLEMNQHSSVSESSDDICLKHFIPNRRTTQEPLMDVLSEKLRKAKLDSISGYSVFFDTDPATEMNIAAFNKGVVHSSGIQKYTLNGVQKCEATPYFSSIANNSVVNIKSHMTSPKPNSASLLDVSRDLKHHSRSSSYHSTSSGDIPIGDDVYVEVSEISLQTVPLQGPPPSRPPPELSKKTEDLKPILTDSIFDAEERSILTPNLNNQLPSRNEATKINKNDKSLKGIPCIHDSEMDPRSTAALSIAAVKEAMEQAQARIKIAKELMDRKCDKYHRKVGLLPKALNSKEDEAASEVETKICSGMTDSSSLPKKCSIISECTSAWEEIRAEGKPASDYEDLKVQLSSYRKDQQQVTKDNASNSSEMTFKVVEIPEEFKMDKKHYELLRHDISFNTDKKLYIQELQKKEKAANCCECDANDKYFKRTLEVDANEKSLEVSFCIETSKEDDLKCSNMTCMEDVKKNIMDACWDEFPLTDATSVLEEESRGSQGSDVNQKLRDSLKDNTKKSMLCKPNSDQDTCMRKESENCSQNTEYYGERLSNASEIVFDYVEGKRKLNVNTFKSDINDSYKGVIVSNETLLQAIIEKGVRVPQELFTYITTDKRVAEKCEPYSNYENEKRKVEQKYSDDVLRCKIEKSDSAIEKNEVDSSQTNEEAPILVENVVEQGLLQDENGLENLKISGNSKNAEPEHILSSRKGTCYNDLIKKESRETGTDLQKDESMESFMAQGVQGSDELESAKGACVQGLTQNITEVTVPYKLVEDQFNLNSTDMTSQLAETEEPETQKVIFSSKEGSLLDEARDKTKVSISGLAENHKRYCVEDCLNSDDKVSKHAVIEESEMQNAILSRKEGSLPAVVQDATEVSHTVMDENFKQSGRDQKENKMKASIDRERDEEQELRLGEKELEGEREKGKVFVEHLNFEARQQALAEAQKRAERNAVERATAEARQRALVDARVKAEKAAEAEKAYREARLRAERTAVERVTEEARRRAIEKSLAEKAAGGARERSCQANASKDRMRKDANFKVTHNIKEDSEARHKPTSTQLRENSQSQSASYSTNAQRYSNSSNYVGGSDSNIRNKAGQERQEQTAVLSANALSEKSMREILAQRDQVERERLAESLDVLVRRWSMGKDGNLRSLLSTLQFILAPESNWQPIHPSDLLNVPAVKKAYKKATLCVHPDKLQQRGATIQQKYICEKVFDLLKDAWDKFNSEEK